MLNNFEITLALRYLRSKTKEKFISVITLLSLIGISLGTATLIIVTSVMNGFHTDLMSRITGVNGHITIYKFDNTKITNEDYKQIKEQLCTINSIRAISPTINRQILLMSDNNAVSGAKINAIEDMHNPPMTAEKIIFDLEPEATGGVVMGWYLAQNLGLKIGDKIKIINLGITSTHNIKSMITPLKITGIFSTNMSKYDETHIYMSLKLAQNILKAKNVVDYIEIFLNNPMDSKKIANYIKHKLKKDNLRIIDWQTQNLYYIQALDMEKKITFLVITLIIVVAAFNITSSLIMLAQEKKANIAILRTMGASKNSIMKIFFICGATIGIVGTLTGTLIGVAIMNNFENIKYFLYNFIGNKILSSLVYFIVDLPAEMKYQNVLFIMSIALGLSFVAAIFPAYKAAKQNPAEILSCNAL